MRIAWALSLLSIAALLASCQQSEHPVVSGAQTVPSPRTDAAAAYDSASREVVMFGGTNRSGALNETWAWDGSGWHQRHPEVLPPPRQDAILAFDPSSNRLILYGGVTCGPFQPTDPIGCDGSDVLADTWAWDGTDWSRINTTNHPQVDYFGADRINAATDDAHRQIILVAHGHGGREDRVETWSFAGGDWHELSPAHIPHLWDFSGPQFDGVSGRLILQQGPVPHFDCGTAPCENDFETGMWAWDGSDWQTLTPPTPPALGDLFRTARGLMLFGDGGQYLWNGSGWDAGEQLPWKDTQREGWAGAYDASRRTLVVYGGQAFGSNHLFGDLLGWDGTGWKTLAPAPTSDRGPFSLCTNVGPPGTYSVGPNGASVSFDEPLSGPCHLRTTVQFALLGPSGELVPVPGNPSEVKLDQDLTYDAGTIEVSFAVTGACELSPATTGRISVATWQQTSPPGVRPCDGSPPRFVITSSVRTIAN